MAYPTQLRRSCEPCESQVFDDCVIQMRRNRTVIGDGFSASVTVPPLPLSTVPACETSATRLSSAA